MAINGGDVLLEVFKSYGVEYIFSSPGSEWASVWENLAKRYDQGDKSLKYINCRHESLAVSAAFGYAKATGRLPAVLLHAAVGPLNGALPIRAAYRARVPMIICTGDTSGYGEDGKGAPWYWMGNLSDIGGNDTPVNTYVKWSNAVTSKETLMSSVYRGCGIAQAHIKGPVFLSIPLEFLFDSQPQVRIPPSSSVAALPEPRPRDLEEVANHLLESKQPIILTEHAGENAEAGSKLVELAELLSIPVFECLEPRFANFPKNHPLHMGYDAVEALQKADTIFIVGATTPWHPCSAFPQNGAKVILLDEDPLKERLPYWGYRIDLSVTADIGQGLTALVDIIRARLHQSDHPGTHYQERFERWQTKHAQIVEQLKTEALAGQGNKPISPKWFLYTLNKILPSNSMVLQETITHRNFIHRYVAQPNAYFRVIGGLGIGLGIAAGAKLGYPDRPVIFLIGDGTFNYNPVLAGLGLCQEYHLPILTIILNNGSYAAMKFAHQRYYPQGWAVSHNTYFGVDITPQPDYIKVAEAFDAYAERVEEPGDIEPALNRALEQIATGRAALLDVILEIPPPMLPKSP